MPALARAGPVPEGPGEQERAVELVPPLPSGGDQCVEAEEQLRRARPAAEAKEQEMNDEHDEPERRDS